MELVFIACDKKVEAWQICKNMDTKEFFRMFYLKHKNLTKEDGTK